MHHSRFIFQKNCWLAGITAYEYSSGNHYVQKGVSRERHPNLAFHSNRGSQYISKTFAALFQQCNVKQSFSATARPLGNAVAETFFSTFKREEAYERDYTSEQHFRRSTAEYIQFYNEVRPRQTLQYKTPQAFKDTYNTVLRKRRCLNTRPAQKF